MSPQSCGTSPPGILKLQILTGERHWAIGVIKYSIHSHHIHPYNKRVRGELVFYNKNFSLVYFVALNVKVHNGLAQAGDTETFNSFKLDHGWEFFDHILLEMLRKKKNYIVS